MWSIFEHAPYWPCKAMHCALLTHTRERERERTRNNRQAHGLAVGLVVWWYERDYGGGIVY